MPATVSRRVGVRALPARLLACLAVDGLAEQVEVTAVPGVLVDHLDQRIADRADPVVGVPDDLEVGGL